MIPICFSIFSLHPLRFPLRSRRLGDRRRRGSGLRRATPSAGTAGGQGCAAGEAMAGFPGSPAACGTRLIFIGLIFLHPQVSLCMLLGEDLPRLSWPTKT